MSLSYIVSEIYTESQKTSHSIFACNLIRQLLADFQNSFNCRFSGKFATAETKKKIMAKCRTWSVVGQLPVVSHSVSQWVETGPQQFDICWYWSGN